MNLFVVRTWLQARFSTTERGASMVEYILLVALIALAVIAAVSFLGRGMTDKFNTEGSQLSSVGEDGVLVIHASGLLLAVGIDPGVQPRTCVGPGTARRSR